jgi:hypothetical protein
VRSCPSTTCQPDAVLLGVVGPDGRVRYVSPALTIDEEFVARAHEGRAPEKRFRFAGPCVEDGCAQWTGHSCGVATHVVERATAIGDATSRDGRALPRCAIRRTCRWFAQEGAEICHVCPTVVTDGRATPSRSP